MNQSIKNLSSHLEDLPMLPAIVVQVLNLSRDDKDYFEKILPLAQKDPSFALRIVKRANSSAYRPRTPINDLRGAVARIGAYQVAALITSMAVMQVFVPNEKDARNLWLHSIQVASSSRIIAEKFGLADPDVAYLCGLMHDIGRFVLFDVASQDVRRIDESGWDTPDQLIDVEQRMLGIDHSELGWQICHKWMMPEHVCVVVRNHHHPNEESLRTVERDQREMIKLINLADHFSVLLLKTPDIQSQSEAELATLIEKRVIGPASFRTGIKVADLQKIALPLMEESLEHCTTLGLRVG